MDNEGKRPAPEAQVKERLAHLLPLVLVASPVASEACELLTILLIEVGNAHRFGRHDAYEAGKRDFSREILNAVKVHAPSAYNNVVHVPPAPVQRLPVSVKVAG